MVVGMPASTSEIRQALDTLRRRFEQVRGRL
jgi:hypothetical protein